MNVEAMGEAIDAVQAILDPIKDPHERLIAYADLMGRMEVLAPEAVLTACQAHQAFRRDVARACLTPGPDMPGADELEDAIVAVAAEQVRGR